MGLESPSQRTLVIVILISSGVALASYGEIDLFVTLTSGYAPFLRIVLKCLKTLSYFSGFIFQSLGILFEAARLVSIQKLLHGMKMDPLVSLYYFAPVCAGINALLIPFYEGSAPFYQVWDKLGLFVLLTNASCAFLLNIAVVFLIGSASSLVLTLSGPLLLCLALFFFPGSCLLNHTHAFRRSQGYPACYCFRRRPRLHSLFPSGRWIQRRLDWVRTR
jgi:hypothetical protein